MVNGKYTGIDFVGMYTDRMKSEEEFDQVDDMLKAAAILVVKVDEVLDGLVKETGDGEG